VPIATELPEKYNSIVWLGKKKDHLALGNLTGAMVFQGCIPTAIGLIFTPWVLTPQSSISILLCLGATLLLLISTYIYRCLSPGPMLLCGLFYISFLVYGFQSASVIHP
jgi:cation:H+ antiporter